MNRREAWLTASAIFVIALAIRALAALQVPFPIPEDTAYYHGVARNLAQGRGLVSDALWSYGTPPLVFPRPAFEVWLPLPSLLIAPLMALLGTSYRVAEILPVLAGAAVAVLAWRLGADVAAELGLPPGRARTLALGAGLTAAVELPLVLHSTLADSTMLFALLAVASCLLMTRIVADPREARARDWRLLALGLLIGLAALTRNEAAWLAVAWVVVAWFGARIPGRGRAERVRLIAIPGIVAFAVFVPWMIRDWATFGSPLPGQALSNALSVTGFDIFAWSDPPTLSRYLAQGPSFLLQSRIDGLAHNLFTVLLIPSFPIGVLGLLALPRFGRLSALRPLVLLATITFLVTTLAFPVSTTWGTFLHAAGPVHVLLAVSCLAALDAFIAWVGRHRGWTNPVAWLGPTLTVAASILFTVPGMVQFGSQAADVESRLTDAGVLLASAGADAGRAGPVITDFPIWFAETQGAPALALPDEGPRSVLDLAHRFGARFVLLSNDDRGIWPGVLETPAPGARCFRRYEPPAAAGSALARALDRNRLWEVTCP